MYIHVEREFSVKLVNQGINFTTNCRVKPIPLPQNRPGESETNKGFEIAGKILVRPFDLHGTSYEHVAAGASSGAHGAETSSLLSDALLEPSAFAPMLGLAPTALLTSGSIPHA